MPTLWQILTQEKTPTTPLEFEYHNPLKLRVGNQLKINTLELEDCMINVTSIREVRRRIDGVDYFVADYDITAKKPFGSTDKPIKKKLRLVPLENKEGSIDHSVLLLNLLDEFIYNKEFHEGLDYSQNQGEFKEGDDMYWRVNDVKSEWNANTVTMTDRDGDGTLEAQEIKRGKLTYWDFWRETVDEGNNKILEFYIVEMNEDGYFQIWVGSEIDPTRVEV